MKLFVAILLALFALPSIATNLTVTCVAPAKNADGTPFATGVTLAYNLYGNYQGNPLVLLTPTPSPTCLFVRQNVNPGTIVYALTAVETLNGIVGPESAQTTPIATIVPSPPPAPGGVTVSLATTSTIVYALINGENTFAPLIVGSAPLASACDATHSAQAAGVTYYVIPWTVVTYSGALKPHTAYANCS